MFASAVQSVGHNVQGGIGVPCPTSAIGIVMSQGMSAIACTLQGNPWLQ